MLKKAVGIILLTAFGSFMGIVIYVAFFGKETVYVQRESFQPIFSNYPTKKQEVPAALPDFAKAAQNTRPAVVHIRAHYGSKSGSKSKNFFNNPFRDFFDEDNYEHPQGMASGSGAIISADGYIATNNHVIEGASEVKVTLFDNRSFIAKVIGRDVTTDLALLKIDIEGFPYLKFGDSDLLQVGEWVLAVGNPMDLNSTVTAGIVSAKGRNLNLLQQDSNIAIESFIQTDAAVNKGNSGGALVNTSGELVGINTAIASHTGYYAGYSFAIPSTIAQKVMEDLLSYGEVRRGFLGVRIQAVNSFVAEKYDLHILKGAYVTGVNEQSGAAEAGIRPGDVIVSVNELAINSSSELQEQISRYHPGETINIKVFRDEQEIEFKVLLKTMEGEMSFSNPPSRFQFKGSLFRALTEDERDEYQIEGGVVIIEVGEEMKEEGIKEGFVITSINNFAIGGIEDLDNIIAIAEESITIKGFYKEGKRATYYYRW